MPYICYEEGEDLSLIVGIYYTNGFIDLILILSLNNAWTGKLNENNKEEVARAGRYKLKKMKI